jgi:hypothetical protein
VDWPAKRELDGGISAFGTEIKVSVKNFTPFEFVL